MTDVYCSTKFTEIQVHIQNRLISNCCKAWPEKINLEWLEQNPGKLFLTETIVEDRRKMLLGEKCYSCDFGCYQDENKGLVSKRSKKEGDQTFINDPFSLPTSLDIVLSTDCNLSCLYCGPEYSLSWTKDLIKNGNYAHEDTTLKLRPQYQIALKIKQKTRSTESKFFKLVLSEIKIANTIKNINLLGGEPLLNDGIYQLIDEFPDKTIKISTGLGVSKQIFKKFLEKIKNKNNIQLTISAESTGKNFEFLRYGAEWVDFYQKIEQLKSNKIQFTFNSVITNISSFDLENFYKLYGNHYSIRYGNVNTKPYLQPNVLDEESKDKLINKIKCYNNNVFFSNLKQEVEEDCSEKQRTQCGYFLKEFSKRRNLKLDIFPAHFLKWLGLD
jgi:organic radical activating enzyme